MVNFEVVAGSKQTPIVGAYLLTSTLEHLPDLEESLTRFRDQYPIVLGNLNSDIGEAHNHYIHKVADLLMEFGMVDLLR